MASARQLLAAQSWSVEDMGNAVDDARKVDGVWYRRSIITKKFIPIGVQRRVVPLFRNPRPISP
jgi:hypothetical protein